MWTERAKHNQDNPERGRKERGKEGGKERGREGEREGRGEGGRERKGLCSVRTKAKFQSSNSSST